MVGYNSNKPIKGKKGMYGGRSTGKYDYGCGGFNGLPTVSFEKITDEQWNSIFGEKTKWYEKEDRYQG